MVKMISSELSKLILIRASFALLFGCSAISAKEPLSVWEYSDNKSGLEITGPIRAGKSWIQGVDTNIAVVTEVQSGKPCDPNYSHRLFGYRFTKTGAQWKNLWTIRDQASGCQDLQYFDSTLEVIDVDGNGDAETVFFYSLFSDGTDPQNLKMMFHFNGAKMPIRGRIPMTEDDAQAYKMELDPKLTGAPPLARDFALAAWKGFLSKNFKEEVPASALK